MMVHRQHFPQAYRNRANVELRLGQLDPGLADLRRAGVDPLPLLLVIYGVSFVLALAGAFGTVRWLRGRLPRSV